MLTMALSPLTFPTILSPYGIAVVLLLTIIGERVDANLHLILAFVLILMALDYIGMLFARGALKVLRPEFLQVLGGVLSVIKLGIGIGANATAIGEKTPGVVRLLPETLTFEFPVWLIAPRELKTSRRVRIVFDTLADYLARS